MEKWTANIINNPNNDYEIMIEINYGKIDVAAIKSGQNGLELELYANNKNFKIPVEWLLDLLHKAKQDIPESQKK